jgi:hypothetical protein
MNQRSLSWPEISMVPVRFRGASARAVLFRERSRLWNFSGGDSVQRYYGVKKAIMW